MTNEELDNARVKEAQRLFLDGSDESPTILIAARLAREGWTPPVGVDPDLAEAEDLHEAYIDNKYSPAEKAFYHAIKRGRALAAEAKPGMVWVKHDGSGECPVDLHHPILIKNIKGCYAEGVARVFIWHRVTHYAIITPPEEK